MTVAGEPRNEPHAPEEQPRHTKVWPELAFAGVYVRSKDIEVVYQVLRIEYGVHIYQSPKKYEHAAVRRTIEYRTLFKSALNHVNL